MTPAPAAKVACPVPGCAAWRPRRQRRTARPGRAAARADATAISTKSGHPRPGAEAGQGRLIWRTRLAGQAREHRAGRSRELLARGVHPELTPEPLGLRHVPGLGEPARAEQRSRAGHRTYVAQLGVADLKAAAAHGTDQVVVRPVRHDRHEVQAHRLLRPDVMEKHLVMTVRAHARRDLALIFRATWPETENHHHAAIEAEAPGAAIHPWQVRAGDVVREPVHRSLPHGAIRTPTQAPGGRSAQGPARMRARFGSRLTRGRVMTQAQLADTLAGCVNQRVN